MSSALHPSLVSLLDALSAAVGERIELNVHGECCLEFDDHIDIALAQAGDPDILSIRCSVSAANQPLDSELLQLALSLNYTDVPPGYSIALDAATGSLFLVALVDTVETSQESFLRIVAGFLEIVPELRDRCAHPVAHWQTPLSHGVGATA